MQKTSRRTATGNDKRGNSKDRAARKAWMLRTFGNGETCACVHCGCELTAETLQADRIVPGGSYRHSNIQPSCGPDNRERSNKADWVPPRLRGLFRSQLVPVS